ncbi:MAG: hypothetical protein ABIR68_04115 [Ilumatobacteraceae bacterium]
MNRVRVARWIGEQAVTYGRREIVRAFAAGARPSGPDDEPATDAVLPVESSPTADLRGGLAPAGDAPPVQPIAPALAAELVTLTLTLDDTSIEPNLDLDLDLTSPSVVTPLADVPPFEGYDTLPAAHIVQRLTRLTPIELAAVRAYELGHRGRRTVVAKVDQLLDAG